MGFFEYKQTHNPINSITLFFDLFIIIKMVVTQNQSIDQTSSSTSQLSSTDWNKVEISFKRKDFQHSYVMPSTSTSQTNVSANSLSGSSYNSSSQTAKAKKKQWRTLKQILAAEQVLP